MISRYSGYVPPWRRTIRLTARSIVSALWRSVTASARRSAAGLPELGDLRGLRVPAKVERHVLVARTDPQDRHARAVDVLAVPSHRARVHPHPGGAAGQDEPVDALQLADRRRVRDDLRLDP